MSLCERIQEDNARVFMRLDHFASVHTWNGEEFTCVTDEEEAIKRKNNNVNDISWDNNIRNVLLHVPLDDFPGQKEPEPNVHVFYDGRAMKVLYVDNNMGMLDILLAELDTRELM